MIKTLFFIHIAIYLSLESGKQTKKLKKAYRDYKREARQVILKDIHELIKDRSQYIFSYIFESDFSNPLNPFNIGEILRRMKGEPVEVSHTPTTPSQDLNDSLSDTYLPMTETVEKKEDEDKYGYTICRPAKVANLVSENSIYAGSDTYGEGFSENSIYAGSGTTSEGFSENSGDYSEGSQRDSHATGSNQTSATSGVFSSTRSTDYYDPYDQQEDLSVCSQVDSLPSTSQPSREAPYNKSYSANPVPSSFESTNGSTIAPHNETYSGAGSEYDENRASEKDNQRKASQDNLKPTNSLNRPLPSLPTSESFQGNYSDKDKGASLREEEEQRVGASSLDRGSSKNEDSDKGIYENPSGKTRKVRGFRKYLEMFKKARPSAQGENNHLLNAERRGKIDQLVLSLLKIFRSKIEDCKKGLEVKHNYNMSDPGFLMFEKVFRVELESYVGLVFEILTLDYKLKGENKRKFGKLNKFLKRYYRVYLKFGFDEKLFQTKTDFFDFFLSAAGKDKDNLSEFFDRIWKIFLHQKRTFE